MLFFTDKNVFETDAKVLVNAVNVVGVMGAGIALEFKNRYPDMYKDYYHRCMREEFKIGEPYLYGGVYNFPTKKHWKSGSSLSYIDKGLEYFVNTYKGLGIDSIAFPKLGCGRGGLEWEDVKSLMIKHLDPFEIDIQICLATRIER